MNQSITDESPIQNKIPESFVQRSQARQEKLRQAAADRKARINCDSDDSMEMRKEPIRKSNMREVKRDTSKVSTKVSNSDAKIATAKSLKKSRSLPLSILKPKQEPYPAMPLAKSKGPIVNDSLSILPSLSGNEPSKPDSNTQQRRSPYPTVHSPDNSSYDSIEEQLISIYGESKWLREESGPKGIPSESIVSSDADKSKAVDATLLCKTRPKVHYDHFLSSTIPLLHRFTYSQINTLSRKESELIKQFQVDGDVTQLLEIRNYANHLEPILRQKIGLLIVLYESVRDVASASSEEVLQDLECGEGNSVSTGNN